MSEITPWHWAGFILCILFFIALDLGALSRRPGVPGFWSSLAWSGLWVGLALIFAMGLSHWRGRAEATQFVTGYLIELSLSLDNILVIALIFSAFKVPATLQHPVLLWGILGALTMRGMMIGLGAALIHQFSWVLYLFGAFLMGVKTIHGACIAGATVLKRDANGSSRRKESHNGGHVKDAVAHLVHH